MLPEIKLRKADLVLRPGILSLLQAEKLPAQDLGDSLEHFFVALDRNEVVGAVGLESYGEYGLLRSLVVNSAYRGRNIAGELVSLVESKAKSIGVTGMYLLTETAPAYFEKKGYEKIIREDVPDPIKQSSEFSHVCPVSAIVMKKII